MSKYKMITIVVSLILLSFLIFYTGDQISFGNKTPLETILSQCVLVCFIWGVFVLVWFWKKYQVRKAEESLVKQMTMTEDVISNEEKQIKDKFIKALKSLHSDKKFSINQGMLYQKPWYILIGAPGSGKTTTLVNSMLTFADSHELAKQAVQGVGGTRLCDWWFTNEATLIDTAGRFTTQTSDTVRDQAAWKSFIEGLKKNRPLQPINGVMVFLSVTDLLSEDERLKRIQDIKSRLKELSLSLAVKIPVYIIINKMDLLLGFNEFFSTFNQDARNQVFGVTLPYGAAVNTSLNILNNNIDEIYSNFENKKIDLIEGEINLINKSKILLFPERFKLLSPSVVKIFTELSFEEGLASNVDIRGFYFTSATQLGSPIDNILNNSGLFSSENKEQLTPTIGKSFFINDLLKKVIFLEAGLVAKDKFFDSRKVWYISYLFIPIIFFSIVGLWTVSYLKTKSYISQIEVEYQRIFLIKKQVNYNDIISLSDYLQEINLFKDKVDESYNNLLLNGLGINILNIYAQQVNYAYVQSLKVTLAQLLYREISTKLNEDKSNYLLLKSYLLLADNNAHKVNTKPLAKMLVDDVILNKRNIGESQRLSLIINIDKLLQERPLILSTQLDQNLIHDARSIIKANGFVDVIYSILQENIGKEVGDWMLLKEADNNKLFIISDQKNMDIVIPAFYTKEAFYKIKDTYLNQAMESLESDSAWVLDIDENNYNTNKKELRDLVLTKYLKNYHERWSNFINKLSVTSSSSVSESLSTVKLLSINDKSTLKKLVDAVIKQTILTQNITGNKIADIVDKLSSKIMEDSINKQAKAIVDDKFLALANLFYSADYKKDLDEFNTLIKEIETQLYLLEETSKKGQPLPDITPLQVKIMTTSNTMPAPLSGILKGVYINIGKLSQGAADQGMKNQLKEVSNVCQKMIKNTYPFSKSSSKDINFIDFGKLFSSQGLLSTFFEKKLETFVDKTNQIWTPINSPQGVSISTGVVSNFQRANNIKNGFFQNNMALPYFSFSIRWLEVPPEMLLQQASISIDGQQSLIQPNYTQAFNWPILPDGNQVVINLGNTNLSGYKFEGPWAILRFIDKGNPIYENKGQKIRLKWNTGAGILSGEVLSLNPNNPFIPDDLERFSCNIE